MMKIGILGGTFDPVHIGHLALARAAQKQFQLDKILFIPAYLPPHKTGIDSVSPAHHRYRMVELAIQNEPDFIISDIEYLKEGPSYTVETLELLKIQYPHEELFLILGEDNLSTLPQWKNPSKILSMVKILVARRFGTANQTSAVGNIAWIAMPMMPVSASKIREQIRKGQMSQTLDLSPAVEDYIRRTKLYLS
jgi:nicotinate-nucleotide adenylyltransferase